MYAQIATPQFHKRRHSQTMFLNPRIVTGDSRGFKKGIHARNVKRDCIKYLKLGEPTPESADIIADTVTSFCGEGQTADVNISYVGDGEISSVRMAIDSALPIAGITSNYEFEYNEEDGWIIIWAKNGASFGESVLLTLHYDLDVDPAYDDGEYTIGIELIEVTDEDEKLIELTSQNGAVIIEKPIKLGDVNMDGVVDNRDIIMIARYLVSLVRFDDDQAILADFNCDGIVNNTDLVLVSRYIVGLA